MSSQSDELAAWLRLEQTAGVGPETARRLLAVFGLPQNIFNAGLSELLRIVPERVALALIAPLTDAALALLDKTQEWSEQPCNHVLTLADSGYPKSLFDTANPPLVLYAKGRLDLLQSPSLAIVGSRNATAQGCINAEKFAEALSQAGLTIVSGLALGIDAAAHQGGLKEAGSTVAVIGTGIDIVYPARNRSLAHQIADKGCLLSEYPLGTPAIAGNFPRRNRIISGLSLGVLVIEAAAQSGSLITARLGAEQGREVFAIPGSIHSPFSRGCHQLIRQGAKLVESAQDVLEELDNFQLKVHERSRPELCDDSHAGRIFNAMGFDPVAVDELGERSSLDMATLSAELLNLELDGLVEALPGGLYRRIVR